MCSKCILDTIDDPNISFNSYGICNHCTIYDQNLKKFYFGDDPDLKKFFAIIDKIKKCKFNNLVDILLDHLSIISNYLTPKKITILWK